MESITIQYQRGFAEAFRAPAARLYDAAFGPKLAVALPNESSRLEVLRHSFQPEYAFAAFADDQLVGLAGVHEPDASFTGGMNFEGLWAELGFFSAMRAGLILSLYERKPRPNELLMDGIAVDPAFRGQGIGSRLLDEILNYAQERSYEQVRLDVIDTNPGARRLYERKQFQATHTERFEYLRWLLGFGESTTMIREIAGLTEGWNPRQSS